MHHLSRTCCKRDRLALNVCAQRLRSKMIHPHSCPVQYFLCTFMAALAVCHRSNAWHAQYNCVQCTLEGRTKHVRHTFDRGIGHHRRHKDRATTPSILHKLAVNTDCKVLTDHIWRPPISTLDKPVKSFTACSNIRCVYASSRTVGSNSDNWCVFVLLICILIWQWNILSLLLISKICISEICVFAVYRCVCSPSAVQIEPMMCTRRAPKTSWVHPRHHQTW